MNVEPNPSGMTGWAKTAVAGGIFSFLCVVVWWILHAMEASHARTLDTVQAMHDAQREDRKAEQVESRESLKRAWDTMAKIRESVDRNTSAMNELTQTIRASWKDWK